MRYPPATPLFPPEAAHGPPEQTVPVSLELINLHSVEVGVLSIRLVPDMLTLKESDTSTEKRLCVRSEYTVRCYTVTAVRLESLQQ